MANPIRIFDFTLPADGESAVSLADLKSWCKRNCKAWIFQKEQGEETGYIHWQGRINLKVKERLTTLAKRCHTEGLHFRWSPTHDTEHLFYVTKEQTRIEGPWSDKEEPLYVPRDLREITLWYPWQTHFEELCSAYEARKINVLYDPVGGKGKSTIIRKLCVERKARQIPFGNDYRDISRMVMDAPKVPAYICDMPRAVHKDKLYQFWSAMESLKGGYAFDDRYSFREEYFDPPVVWVITNVLPERSLLSRDRWVYWLITNTNELVQHDPLAEGPFDNVTTTDVPNDETWL